MRAFDLSNARWTKSTYSNGDGDNCVEVADGVPGVVPVRDSKVAGGPVVVVGSVAWTEFVRTVGALHQQAAPGPTPAATLSRTLG
ncbi:DUF397 domain-containing protein [Streptomyces mutabilis]|uniref:DUF397 domain-containing protein n=1 Tax=Streptomyces mutabilis TaxID=67332 RepID=UPI0017843E99|nr:DUF397 domain-containing protein [Streptomyces mutabilis]GGQ00159.1 hypothetical protein GCM10010279_03760 [Streptomyces mutabilis]